MELCTAPTGDGISLEESILRSGAADERQIAEAYSHHYLLPLFDPPDDTPFPVDPRVAKLLPGTFCRDHLIAPLSDDGYTLEVAIFSADSLSLVDEIKRLAGRQMRPLFATMSVIQRLLGVLYELDSLEGAVAGPESTVAPELLDAGQADCRQSGPEGEIVHVHRPRRAPGNDPVQRYLAQVFDQALQVKASDIHLEPGQDSCRARLRSGGVLREIQPPPTALFDAVISHLKSLGKMDAAEQRLPQDGVIRLRSGKHRVDVRVSTCPTVLGEKVVLRLLDNLAAPHDLNALGFDARQLHDVYEANRFGRGLILVTGPAGSGKSATLCACLKHLHSSETNICTVEDRVEFRLSGINQVQLRSELGLNAASAARSLLRQDPDVIMVDEVRDRETLEVCAHAALGHRLVCASFCTHNDSLGSVARLGELGIEPSLLASSLRLVIAQRLLRRLCPHCKIPQCIDAPVASRFGIAPGTPAFGPSGCSRCRETGYEGRLAVFEVMRVDGRLREMLQGGATVAAMKTAAIEDGMTLLQPSAIGKLIAGLTSLDEALGSGGSC